MNKIFLISLSLCFLNITAIAQDAEARLKEKGIVLTAPGKPVANYVNAVRVGNLLYLAGKDPQNLMEAILPVK